MSGRIRRVRKQARFTHGREWRRTALVGLLAAAVIAAIAFHSTAPSAPFGLVLVVGCATAVLASQPLFVTDAAQITGIDATAMPMMVGLAWLSPWQFVVALSLGHAAGWFARRQTEGVALRSDMARLKWAASQATSLGCLASALATYNIVGPEDLSGVVLVAAGASVVAEVLAATAMALIIGPSGREPLPRQLLRIARTPALWIVVLSGGVIVALSTTQTSTAVWLLAATACLWGLGRHQQRQQDELARLRALIRVARDIPTLERTPLEEFLTEHARILTHAGSASLDEEGASGTSFGVPIDDQGEHWLNVHERTRGGETFRSSERETLRGLASLARLALQTVTVTEELQHAASHDQLTGLVSRRGLEDLWPTTGRRAARHGRSLAIVYLDLDGFKQVNDREGHAAGDAILCETGRRLASVARGGDIVCRLGGDEFVLVAEDIPDVPAAESLVERVEVALIRGTDHHDGPIPASVGAALYPSHGTSLDAVLRVADASMYVAKRSSAHRGDR